jgi:hypothetical protein
MLVEAHGIEEAFVHGPVPSRGPAERALSRRHGIITDGVFYGATTVQDQTEMDLSKNDREPLRLGRDQPETALSKNDRETVRIHRDGRVAPATPEAIAAAARPAVSQPRRSESSTPRRFDVARINDNELILFVGDRRESWIVYPPRSAYDFLDRPTPLTVLVEHHPWAPYSEIVMHEVDAAEGCREHGLNCGASSAIQAGVRAGWDPFS